MENNTRRSRPLDGLFQAVVQSPSPSARAPPPRLSSLLPSLPPSPAKTHSPANSSGEGWDRCSTSSIQVKYRFLGWFMWLKDGVKGQDRTYVQNNVGWAGLGCSRCCCRRRRCYCLCVWRGVYEKRSLSHSRCCLSFGEALFFFRNAVLFPATTRSGRGCA